MAAPTPTTGLTFDYVNSTIYNVVQNREQELQTQIAALGPNPTTADLLNMQQKLQQWTMTVQLQSTIVKDLGDTLKGIIQKMG